MSMAMDAQCLVCHFRRNVGRARALGDGQTATAFARELMQVYLDLPEDAGSPSAFPATNALFQKYYGQDLDRFREEKEASNRFVMERLDAIRARAEAAPDPVLAGLQFAILGNYIDFSALQGEVSFEKLDKMLECALQMELPAYPELRRELRKAKKLLYLTDNAGEIGFDRIFAQQIARFYPQISITFCVRGGPAQNDATRADAAAVGIPFPVIDNGTCIPGTDLTQIGVEARAAMDDADLIIAKGQGNTETLLGCGYPIYYAFLVKCDRFITRFGVPKLTPMLVRERLSTVDGQTSVDEK